nr:hypothetical protein GCM10020092_030190 [Actinoplanes digitatis]
MLGGRVGVPEALRTGAGVGAARVEHDGTHHAALEDLLAPHDGRGLDPVGGEDTGDGGVGPVVDDERDVGRAVALEPGGDAAGPETLGGW